MEKLNLKPTHKPVQNYYEALRQFKTIGVSHEGAVRSAFQTLLEHCGRQFGWKLVPEWQVKRNHGHPLRVDGALVDEFRLTHGFWEAKDSHDDLGKEVTKKLTAGYPQNNIIFQAPERAILWQNGRVTLDEDITEPVVLVEVLKRLFEYIPPEFEEWTDAIGHFQSQVPELGRALKELIEKEQKSNARFRTAFDDFYALCRQSINPNLSKEAVEEMLIQHLLTERIFRTVFNNPDFTRRNAIAAEIEKVIDALTSQAFTRDAFLQSLDRFYQAIDKAARTIEDFSEKQRFLNTVYEKFFQGFSVKVADTHGIVYTPPPIVNFMVRSVEEILKREFGKSLGSRDVHILDPFVGTGNFIVHVMQEMKKSQLQQKYESELHCNEVMLLPYYVASMNIEHQFFESTGSYEPFPGICLVDTFELAEDQQISFFTTENTARVERQKRSPIRVVIGNPPYNAWQLNENDNNKNRKYKVMDRRVAETFAKESKATNKSSLSDPYVKAIRWASDRIGDEGVVAFVSNNSFLDNLAFDGMRKQLAHDFDEIYILDLGGNVRKNPKLSGTTHNVFGIQVGVSVNLFVRKRRGVTSNGNGKAKIHYARVDEFWRKEQKYTYLDEKQHIGNVEWQDLQPDVKGNWLTEGMRDEFEGFLPIAIKASGVERSIFRIFSNGNDSGRDSWVYNFQSSELLKNAKTFADTYNSELDRWIRAEKPKNIDEFLTNDERRIKWTRNAKRDLKRGRHAEYSANRVRPSLYRPFTTEYLYSGKIFNKEVALLPEILPTEVSSGENNLICLPGSGGRTLFWCLCSNLIPNAALTSLDWTQCFPFYTYNEDGTNRRENITDWALEQFRSHYKDRLVTKWNIFHYVYALLHHPLYRERYAANLKRELHGFLSRLIFEHLPTSASIWPKSTSTTNSNRNIRSKESRSRARSLIGGSSG